MKLIIMTFERRTSVNNDSVRLCVGFLCKRRNILQAKVRLNLRRLKIILLPDADVVFYVKVCTYRGVVIVEVISDVQGVGESMYMSRCSNC